MKPLGTWTRFIHDNFTSVVLLFLVIMSFTATMIIMHEQHEPDEYAKWAQGFTEGLLTSLGISLRPPASHPQIEPPKEPAA